MIKHALLGAVGAMALMAASPVFAAPATYTLATPNYSNLINGPCAVGNCGLTYTAAQSMSGTVTFAAPLAANLTNADVGTQITAYSINDGQQVFSSASAEGRIGIAMVSTNAAGALTSFSFQFQRLHGTAPYTINDSNDASSRVSTAYFQSAQASVMNNSICGARGVGGSLSAAAGADACWSFSGQSNQADAFGAVTFIPPAPAAVPTLSEWAMILLGLAFAGGAALHLQFRRRAA